MSIPISAVLGLVGTLLSLLATAYIGMLKYAINAKEKEVDKRFADIEKEAVKAGTKCAEDLKAITQRISDEEKNTIRMNGEVAMIKSHHESLNKDIEEIKHNMITKAEFDPRMSNLERTLTSILQEMRTPNRYQSREGFPAVNAPIKR